MLFSFLLELFFFLLLYFLLLLLSLFLYLCLFEGGSGGAAYLAAPPDFDNVLLDQISRSPRSDLTFSSILSSRSPRSDLTFTLIRSHVLLDQFSRSSRSDLMFPSVLFRSPVPFVLLRSPLCLRRASLISRSDLSCSLVLCAGKRQQARAASKITGALDPVEIFLFLGQKACVKLLHISTALCCGNVLKFCIGAFFFPRVPRVPRSPSFPLVSIIVGRRRNDSGIARSLDTVQYHRVKVYLPYTDTFLTMGIYTSLVYTY